MRIDSRGDARSDMLHPSREHSHPSPDERDRKPVPAAVARPVVARAPDRDGGDPPVALRRARRTADAGAGRWHGRRATPFLPIESGSPRFAAGARSPR